MRDLSNPARTAFAATSTCHPKAPDSVFVSYISTLASDTAFAPILAALTVPLRPEDMCIESISGSFFARLR